jgi:hypothetical protein
MHRRGVRVTLLLLLLAITAAAAFILLELDRRSVAIIATATGGLDNDAHSRLWGELGRVSQMQWIALGVTAALLLCGVLALTPRTSAPQSHPVERVSPAPEQQTLQAHPVEAPQRGRPVDLAALARVCTDLSRLTTTDALPDLLQRSAVALHAAGVILWLDAGERLLPFIGHGYSAQIMSRLQPALRTDDTAAATAWRTGAPTVVGGVDGSNGAIVVPLLGVGGCVGVLALEVGSGREHDPELHAAAALVAAQLATVIPAPAADTSAESPDAAPKPDPETRAQSA